MSWRARYFPGNELSKEERATLRAREDDAFRTRFIHAAPGGIACATLGTVACAAALPARWAQWGAFGGGVIGFVLSLVLIAGNRVRSPRPFGYLNQVLGLVTAFAIGEAAAHARGVMSVGLLALLSMWMYGTVVTARRASSLAIAVVIEAVAYAAPSVLAGKVVGLSLFVTLALGAAGIFTFAALTREAAETRMFLAQKRLASTNTRLESRKRHLAAVADELTHRVNAQLARVLDARREVERLERAVARASQPILLERATPPEIVLPSDRLAPGFILGERAKITRPLASGGFADVYLAEDLETKDEIVAKVMRCDPSTSAAQMKRFVLEAAAANTVAHPAVVRVLHVDIAPGGRPYLLTERVQGVTLRWCLVADALSVQHYMAVILATAEALAAVHAAGIVHRDFKPDNLMLQAAEPGIKLLDFGVSRWADSEEHHLTEAGELLGTGAYMAPEQITDGGVISPATDVYALGLTLFECLAGEHPLAGLTLPRMIRAHLRGEIPSLRTRAPLIDKRLVDLVDAMLKSDAKERPPLAEVTLRLRALVPSGVTPVSAFATLDVPAFEPASERSDETATLDAPAKQAGAHLRVTA
ncbi:MAG: serine/threonine protein kinase [Myxococcales bacterium]|nr:serine/threonine protein kinase [Myxococcales bacterium]